MNFNFHLLIFFGVSISAEIISLNGNKSLTCIISGKSLYSAVVIRPWVEFSRNVSKIDNWTNMSNWEYCNSDDCLSRFDWIDDQRWEKFTIQNSTGSTSGNFGIKVRDHPTFGSILTNYAETKVKISGENHSQSIDCTVTVPPSQWFYFSVKKEENSVIITPLDKTVNETKCNVSWIPKWVTFLNNSEVQRKKYKYEFIYSNTTGNEDTSFDIHSSECLFMYVSVDEECLLDIRLKVESETINKTVEGTNKKENYKRWQPINITSNSGGPGKLVFHKRTNHGQPQGFWAISDIQFCRDKKEIYHLNLTSQETTRNQQHVCKTLITDNTNGFLTENEAGVLLQNPRLTCSDVLGNAHPYCENHTICTENGSCFCPWGRRGNDCNERCATNRYGINCSLTCSKGCKCDATRGCLNSTVVDVTNEMNYTSLVTTELKNYTELGDTTTEIPHNENSSATIENTMLEFYKWTLLICLILIILILGLTIYMWKRRKTGHQNQSRECQLELSPIKETNPLIKPKSIYSNKEEKWSHVISLENFESYFLRLLEENPDDNEITQQFESIPKTMLKNCTTGNLDKNRTKNRYKNITPYDNTRVILKDSENDYINANYVDGYNTPKSFIATQAPLPNTVFEFWLMICQEKVTTVVMLTQLRENGLLKSEQYWPECQSKCRFGNISIENISEKRFPNYIVRQLEIRYNDENHFVQQFQYLTWPDHGQPSNTRYFLKFLIKIMKLPQNSPIVVHCNAGCGRTGTYILSDIVLRMAQNEKQVDFSKILSLIRSQRCGLVSNVDQYIFAHFVVLENYFRKDFSIPITDDFENKIRKASEENSLNVLIEYLNKATVQLEKTRLKINLQLTDEEKAKNRNLTYLPEHSRIILPNSSDSASNYINAIAVDCYHYSKKFVVTQQPLASTIEDFWTLIAARDVETVLSLNELIENDPFCPIFWPEDVNQTWFFVNNLKVTFLSQLETDSYRKITLKFDSETEVKESRIVKIIELKGWKRENVTPSLPAMDLIRICKEFVSNSNQVVVTCYDGNTASGLFVALAFLLEKLNLDHVCDVFDAVKSVRESRPQFVGHLEQLKFLYTAALDYIKDFSTYRNFL